MRMNYSKQNINTLLQKDNWTVIQVYQASIALKQNLFEYYQNLPDLLTYGASKGVSNDVIALQKENGLLHAQLVDKEKLIRLLEENRTTEKKKK